MMWLVLIGILMVYLLCFFIHICYNNSQNKLGGRRTSSTVRIEPPSSGNTLSASLRPDGTIVSSTSPLIPRSASGNVQNCCALARKWYSRRNQSDHHHHHHWNLWNWSRSRSSPPPDLNSTSTSTPLNLRVPLPSCLYYNEITQRNSDLPQSALTAQREQQLRQIKLEINELSRRLGIGQLYRERQLYRTCRAVTDSNSNSNTIPDYNYIPIAHSEELGCSMSSTPSDTFTTSSSTPETLARIRRTTRRTRNTNTNNSLLPITRTTRTTQGPRPRCLIVGESGESILEPRRHSMEDRLFINDEEESSSSEDSSSLDDTTTLSNSNSLPFPPHTNTTNSCSSSISLDVDADRDSEALFHCSSSSPATGATRLGLVQTFTLGERGNRSNSRRNEIFHQRQRRLRLIRMEIEDLTLQLSSLSEDRSNSSEHNGGGCSISSSDMEGLVFDQDTGGDASGPNLNSSSSFPYLGELPSYDESIHTDFDSPPPSYDQCTIFNSDMSISSQNMAFYSSQPHNNAHTQVGHDAENSQSGQLTRMTAFHSSSVVCQEKELNKKQESS